MRGFVLRIYRPGKQAGVGWPEGRRALKARELKGQNPEDKRTKDKKPKYKRPNDPMGLIGLMDLMDLTV